MRPHQLALIQAIYDASQVAPSWIASDFDSWARSIASRRGQLDRKKRLSQDTLHAAFRLHGPTIELNRIVYAVEGYLALRALSAIEYCLDVPIGELAALTKPLATGLAWRIETERRLQGDYLPELQRDRAEVQGLVERALSTSLEDEFQKDFMGLVPRQVRHAIGSFYTPQWLARHVVRTVGYRHEDPSSLARSVCDPACGSGVFLIAAAEELRQAAVNGTITPQLALERVTTSLHGIDVELVPSLLATASLTIAAKALAVCQGTPLTAVPSTIHWGDSLDVGPNDTRFDCLVGNPPWVNWEYMPEAYRTKYGELWVDLGIFDKNGRAMSFSKEDISALFVAHAIRYRLQEDGIFAFVLPEALFKSTLNHQGFRRFQLGPERAPYQARLLEDFVHVKPFEGVANRTVVLYGRNGRTTEYPIEFIKWSDCDRKMQPTSGAESLRGHAAQGVAQPADPTHLGSSWSTGERSSGEVHRQLDGVSAYRARTGLFTGGANAVYHLRPLEDVENGLLRVANVVERAKRPVPQVEARLEQDFLYPFLRGRDVSRWKSHVELAVVLPHTAVTKMAPLEPGVLEGVAPATLEYFKDFKSILDERRGFSKWEQQYRDVGFYSCQRVGDYTFADWKVVWRYISTRFLTSVVGPHALAGMPEKPVIPNEKLMLVACESREEAFYLCGVLSGSVVVDHIHSRMVSTQISPSIISGIAIPRFDARSEIHRSIAHLCERGHSSVGLDRNAIHELDKLVCSIWGVPAEHGWRARERNPF